MVSIYKMYLRLLFLQLSIISTAHILSTVSWIKFISEKQMFNKTICYIPVYVLDKKDLLALLKFP
jgi:hypothetical protein